MHVAGLGCHLQRPRIGLLRPLGQLILPGRLFRLDPFQPLAAIAGGGQLAVGELVLQRLRRFPGIADYPYGDLPDEPQHAVIAVDLDDFRLPRPVVEPVLRQGAERTEPGPQRQNHIGLGDQLHRCLGSLIPERAGPQPMVGREAVIVEIAVDHRRVELLGQPHAFLDAVGENDAAAGDDHRELAPWPAARRPPRGCRRPPARGPPACGVAIS